MGTFLFLGPTANTSALRINRIIGTTHTHVRPYTVPLLGNDKTMSEVGQIVSPFDLPLMNLANINTLFAQSI